MKPLQLTKKYPLPKGPYNCESEKLRTLLKRMGVGHSFYLENNSRHVYDIAAELGMKVTVRKIESGGWRVWCVEPVKMVPTLKGSVLRAGGIYDKPIDYADMVMIPERIVKKEAKC